MLVFVIALKSGVPISTTLLAIWNLHCLHYATGRRGGDSAAVECLRAGVPTPPLTS